MIIYKIMNFTNLVGRAVIYVRVSTEKQAREGHGLDSQKDKCIKMINFREWNLVNIYEDRAISGSKENSERQGMTQLLQDARDGKFDIVVIYKLDRLGRTATIVVNTVNLIIDKLNLRLVSCSEDIDTSKPSGRLVLNMFASIAEYEKDIIVERLTMGREHVKTTKGETGGLINYGYVREEGKNIGIAIDKANIVQKIIFDYEDGKSIKDITTGLNDNKVPASKGDIWYSSSVRKILSNREKYEGCIRSGKNANNEKWPVIYTDNFKGNYLSDESFIEEKKKKSFRTSIYMRVCNVGNKKYKTIQEIEIRKYMNENNLFLTKSYFDIGPSFNWKKRNEFDNLLMDAKIKKFSFVLVYRLNVLGHNDETLQTICEMLNEYGIGIISVTGY